MERKSLDGCIHTHTYAHMYVFARCRLHVNNIFVVPFWLFSATLAYGCCCCWHCTPAFSEWQSFVEKFIELENSMWKVCPRNASSSKQSKRLWQPALRMIANICTCVYIYIYICMCMSVCMKRKVLVILTAIVGAARSFFSFFSLFFSHMYIRVHTCGFIDSSLFL